MERNYFSTKTPAWSLMPLLINLQKTWHFRLAEGKGVFSYLDVVLHTYARSIFSIMILFQYSKMASLSRTSKLLNVHTMQLRSKLTERFFQQTPTAWSEPTEIGAVTMSYTQFSLYHALL
jgi:hypothetical protein